MIFFSLSIFAFIFYPVLKLYMFPPSVTTFNHAEYTLVVPKIHAVGRVIENVDPWSQAVYGPILKKGIAQAKGFAKPGEDGVVFLFAHSTGAPWEITHYNTIFLRLSELTKGDKVQIWYKGKEHKYVVARAQEVVPTDVDAVKKEDKADLILQTCTPLGTDWKRLLIFANEER